jgi:PAS domain S-box-containing protein
MTSNIQAHRPLSVANTRKVTVALLVSVALFLGAAILTSSMMMRQVSSQVREQTLSDLRSRVFEAGGSLPSGLGRAKEIGALNASDLQPFVDSLKKDQSLNIVIADKSGYVRLESPPGMVRPVPTAIQAASSGKTAWEPGSSDRTDFYLPLRRGQDTVGVVIFSLDWSQQKTMVSRINFWIWTGTGFTMFLVSFAVWAIYRSLNRDMRRRHRALSAILEQAPIGIYTLDRSGTIDTFNPKMVELSGAASPDKVIGLNVFEMPSYRQANLVDDIRRALTGVAFDKDVEYVSFTASQRTWRHYRGVPIFMPDGKTVDRLLLLVEDISARKDLERKNQDYAQHLEKYAWEQSQQLARKEEQLHTIVDQLPVVFWAVDPRGIFTISEGSGLAALGLKSNEAVGRSLFDLFSHNDEFTTQVNRALAGETFSAQAPLGERIYDHNYSPLKDDRGNVIGATGVSVDVTDRARIEQRFKAMVNNAADVMTVISEQGVIESSTMASFRIGGWKSDELIGMSFRDIVHPDDIATVTAKFEECTGAPGRIVNFTYRLKHKDGRYVQVESIVQNYLNEPNIRGIVANTRDMTERSRAEQEIRHSIATQTAMASLSAKFVTIDDFSSAVREVLREIGEISEADCVSMMLFGQDRLMTESERWTRPGRDCPLPPDAEAKLWLSVSGEEISRAVCLHDAETMKAHGEAVAEFCRTYKISAISASPIIAGGQVIGYYVVTAFADSGVQHHCEAQVLNIAAEVTAGALQKRAAYADSRKQTERQAAIAALGQALLLESGEEKIIELGAAAVKRVLGADVAAVLQYRPDTEDFQVRSVLSEQTAVAKGVTLPGGTRSQAGFTVLTRETVIVADYAKEQRFTAVPLGIKGEARSGASVIIGERHQPWGVLNAFSAKPNSLTSADAGFLEAIAHLVSISIGRAVSEAKSRDLDHLKSKFIQVVSHQFRTPLSAVRWNLESLLSGDIGTLTPETREFIRITYEANNEVINRVRDLLTVLDIEERRITLNPEPISFESIIASVAADFTKRLALKRINFRQEMPSEPGMAVMLDQDRVRAIMEKLLDNALAYTPAGGTVTLKMERPEGHLRVSVIDTGIGIPQQEQSRIFERFYRASNANVMRPDASGLGLTIAKYFVEQQDGTLGFDSKEGAGTTFWFELPVK